MFLLLFPLLWCLTKAICILNPIDAFGGFRRSGVDVDVVEDDVGRVHHVYRPQLGLYDVEVADVDVANVPQDKRHWPAWSGRSHGGALGLVSLVIVPDFAVAIDAASAVAVDSDVVSCQDEAGRVVLEFDVV